MQTIVANAVHTKTEAARRAAVAPLPLTGTANGPGANAVRTDRGADAGAILRSILVSPTATLTAADRERIRHGMRSLRLVADRLEEALDSNLRVDALNAATLGADAGIACATISSLIGSKS